MNNPRRIQRHLVKALAAGALLAAAALPLAIATAAGASGNNPTVTAAAFTPHGATATAIGANGTGTVAITGTNFVNDGGPVTLTAACTAGAVTFTNVAETSSTTATATWASNTSASGTCSLSISDDGGSQPAVLAGAFTIDAAPAISSISPSTIWDGTGATTVTITGTGFSSPAVSIALSSGPTVTSSITSSTATSIVLSVTPINPQNSAPAAAGTYNVVVTNGDGGTSNTGSLIVGNGLENLSPSAVPATAGTYSVALLGSGFQYGATLSFTGTNSGDVTVSNTTITSPTSGTATIVVGATTGTPLVLNAVVTNTGAGNNGAVFTLTGGLGVGEASTVAPIITSASPTTAITVGSPATTVTLTGSGFSQYSTVGGAPAHTTYSSPLATTTGLTGTFTATVAAGNGTTAGDATEGAGSVTVTNTAAATTFSPAITIAGPVIASQAPNLVVNAPFGTSITLTGTGFTNTTTGTVTGGASGLVGTVSYLSPTTLSLVVTTSPTGTTGASVQLSQVDSTGTVNSPVFPLTIDAQPTVSGPVTYKVGADVGVGATAQTVYIHGTGFATGATVTAFVNNASVADPNVTATVTAVTATQITATVAVKAPDANAAVGYTVTNTDGGVVKVAAFGEPIFIGAGPTITSVTPASGAAAATTSFAIAGTGFQTGAVATLTPANGTCGATTVSASTTLAVTCTLGAAGVTPTSLIVTNPDGGSATSSPVLAAETAPAFHVSGVHGAAVVGKTVTVTITGTGFYGQPKITSAGFKFGVTKDSGSVLTVRVTASATAKSGEHSLTVILANGKSGKAGFNTKK